MALLSVFPPEHGILPSFSKYRLYALDSPSPEKSNYFTAHPPPPRGGMDLFLDLAHTLVFRTLAAFLASMYSNVRVQSTHTFIFSLAQKFRPALKKFARYFAHPLSNYLMGESSAYRR